MMRRAINPKGLSTFFKFMNLSRHREKRELQL